MTVVLTISATPEAAKEKSSRSTSLQLALPTQLLPDAPPLLLTIATEPLKLHTTASELATDPLQFGELKNHLPAANRRSSSELTQAITHYTFASTIMSFLFASSEPSTAYACPCVPFQCERQRSPMRAPSRTPSTSSSSSARGRPLACHVCNSIVQKLLRDTL